MITVRPVIIDASICYIAAAKLEGRKSKAKRKAEYEVILEDVDHERGWTTPERRQKALSRLSVPGFKAELAVACEVLFDENNHPPVGHFHWDKPNIPKRIYVHPESRKSFYMLNQHHTVIKGTRIVPKRVTRKKIKYYVNPVTEEILHSVTLYKKVTITSKKEKLLPWEERTYESNVPYHQTLDGEEIKPMVEDIHINWLYSLQWDAKNITNLDVVLELLAQES
jgi:hypothetical protein